MFSTTNPGLMLPPLAYIAQYHPRWALAAAEGIPIRPDTRVLSVQFSGGAQIGQFLPASFSQPVTKNSLFGASVVTIDPAAAFPGNPLKGLNDTTMALVSGVTFTLETTGRTGNYTPVFDDIPLQVIPTLLNPFAGMWRMEGPADNVKARFTLQAIPNGGLPFTAWLLMSFAVLEGPCSDWDAMPVAEVRKLLKEKHGICCPG